MKKTLLFLTVAGMVSFANAQDPVYNFFDPADCDADGWLWLDSQEKIDKYVGEGKKIQLVNAQYELQDPNFPDDYYTPESYTDANLKGYNTQGVEGGEGSRTGGIVLPAAQYDPEEDWWPTDGGGILVAMPDCAQFDLYISQSLPNVYTEIYAAREETNDPDDCVYVYDDEEYYDWSTDEMVGGPVITDYAGMYLNMQSYEYDYDYGEGNPDIYSIYGPKGEPRTAYIANYTMEPGTCPMYIQGIRVMTYTNTIEDAGVFSLADDALKINIKGGMISLPRAAQISVYSPSGVKVASAFDMSLDCSSLKGVYLVKVGNKTVKAVF